MASRNITAKFLESVKPPESGRLEISDAKVPGLVLRVTASGSRSWSILVRLGRGGKQKRITLGSADEGHYDYKTIAEAREAAREALRLAKKGVDPAAAQDQADKAQRTFGEVATAYLDRERPNLRPGTHQEWARIIDHDLLPAWRDRPISSITRADVSELASKIADRGAGVQSNRTLRRLQRLLNWAVDNNYIAASPAAKMKPLIREKARDRALTDDEIRWLWKACETDGWPFGKITQLLLLTAQRRDEVTAMRWGELNLDTRTWTIPRERTKSDRGHEVALSELAVSILKELPRISNTNDLVFTTNGRTPVSGLSKAKRRIDLLMDAARRQELSSPDDAGGIPEWILHDLRRTATTGMARLGIAPHVADKVLNHKSGTISGVAAVYNKFQYLSERKAALEAWGRYVQRLVQPAEDNVIALRQA